MSILPDEVLETILLRLPAFDVVRCKRVCNLWRSLISSAGFVAAHLRRSKSDPSNHHHLLVRNSLFDLRRPVAGPFSSLLCFSSEDLEIVGSVNGLICVAGTEDVPYRTLSPDDIWIFNPVTGLSRKLPYSSRAFYDNHHNVKFAFWCDDDDGGVYKVAKFSTDFHGATMFELWVSTCPDTWTVISTFEFDFHFHPRRFHACDVLIGGLAAYWIVVHCDDDGDGYESNDEIVVVLLDFKTLTLIKFVPFSQGQLHMRKKDLCQARLGDPNSILFGGNLNGEFVLGAYSFWDNGVYYDLWTLMKTGMDDTVAACWVKKFTICFNSFPFDKCLGIVNDKLVLTSCGDLLVALCDPLTGMLEVVETGSKLETITLDSACGFVGSLVSIHGFEFESNDLLSKNMGIRWPYSLYPSARREGWSGWRKRWKKQIRRSEVDF